MRSQRERRRRTRMRSQRERRRRQARGGGGGGGSSGAAPPVQIRGSSCCSGGWWRGGPRGGGAAARESDGEDRGARSGRSLGRRRAASACGRARATAQLGGSLREASSGGVGTPDPGGRRRGEAPGDVERPDPGGRGLGEAPRSGPDPEQERGGADPEASPSGSFSPALLELAPVVEIWLEKRAGKRVAAPGVEIAPPGGSSSGRRFRSRRAAMAFMGRRVGNYICSELYGSVMNQRLYSSRVDWKQLRPMILKRIKNRAKDYPIKRMIPVAEEVVRAREIVTEGVSMLLKVVPVHSCKFCPEVHIGAVGHQMKTCHGFKRMIKDQPHKWGPGCLNGILVPVESFHLENMFQDEIKHDQRFDYTRVPAVLELCHQAGAEIPDGVLHRSDKELSTTVKGTNQKLAPLLPDELRLIGQRTMEAWESLRLGVTKLLLVYPSKVCQHCSEVHVGPSGHKARMCGVFKFEGWRGAHKWKKAGVDDLVPPKIVWHQRPHDPPVLVDSGRDYYGHAPAVIALCMQVGARAPPKYHCMMKAHGLAPPIQQDQVM